MKNTKKNIQKQRIKAERTAKYDRFKHYDVCFQAFLDDFNNGKERENSLREIELYKDDTKKVSAKELPDTDVKIA